MNLKTNKENKPPDDSIFTKDQPIAAFISGVFIVIIMFYFGWIAIDRFVELVNALSTGSIETHHMSTTARMSWTDKANWSVQPIKFLFSMAWVIGEMIVSSLLVWGCVSTLGKLMPNDLDTHQ